MGGGIMKKVVNDKGQVAVLISVGFGAGWSSWNREIPELVFDPDVVGMVLSDQRSKIGPFVESKYPDVYVSTLGADQLTVVWVDQGTEFQIDEYDGSESIRFKEKQEWIVA
jgi:hypothetical protein